MRLIAYVRVSTAEQAEQGHSLGHQPARIDAWAALHGHEITRVITDDGVSAGTPLADRPGGAELLAALATHGADGVVATRIDRLFRNAGDGLQFAERFAIRHGVALHCVDTPVDTSTPAGWLSLALQLVVAQHSRLMDIQRARETTASLLRSARKYGHVPYGCACLDGHLHRDAELWAQREKLVQWRDEEELSFRALRERAAEQGIAAPNGGRAWSLQTLHTICRTHASLLHLPFLDPAARGAATPEAEVSPP